ncbi:hypothetical protein BT69DRAFT_1276261, partial [Atractiella rhizophila]
MLCPVLYPIIGTAPLPANEFGAHALTARLETRSIFHGGSHDLDMSSPLLKPAQGSARLFHPEFLLL